MEDSYKNSQEHLHEELLLVDLLIKARIIGQRATGKQPNAYSGLYITEEEIDSLLEGNQDYANWVNEFKFISDEYEKITRAISALSENIRQKSKNTLKKGIELRLQNIVRFYNLISFDLQILLICLAPQFDSKYMKFFTFLHNDVTRKNPSVELLLNLTCGTFSEKNRGMNSFSHQAPLFRNHLLEFTHPNKNLNQPLISWEIKVNTRIIRYLLESSYIDDNIYNFVDLHLPENTIEPVIIPEGIKDKLNNFLAYFKSEAPGKVFLFSLYGLDHSRKQETARYICKELKQSLIIADAEALFHSDLYFEQAIDLLLRESRINNGAIYLENCDFLYDDDNIPIRRYFTKAMEGHTNFIFTGSRQQLPLHGELRFRKVINLEFPLPRFAERKEMWATALCSFEKDSSVNLVETAGKYNLSAEQIRNIVSIAGDYALWRNPIKPVITREDIEEACRIHSNEKLRKLAQRIIPRRSWNDLILEEKSKTKLEELVKMFKHKSFVYSEWEFDKKLSLGKGISALFYGEPGTGKTLAAEIIAYELGMDLYKIDISTVVSKYIGETEKNLSRIFDEAEQSNGVLFFDEADAIFGKRTEVKDSHDRYSNIEVSYLLQRIDEFNGVVIMATNYSGNIDDAFQRRLHFSINFELPNENSRLHIWQQIFPEKIPLEKIIDFEILAKQLDVAGGHIKNIALNAAFYAADDDSLETKMIKLKHISRACKNEFEKIGRLWNDSILDEK